MGISSMDDVQNITDKTLVSEFGVIFTIATILIAFFAISSSCISFYKIKFLHESGLAIIMGLIISAILYYGFDLEIKFEDELFIFFFLPILVFTEGFTIKKGNFFKNFGISVSYGLTGTFLMFLMMVFFNYFLLSADIVTYDKVPNETDVQQIQNDSNLYAKFFQQQYQQQQQQFKQYQQFGINDNDNLDFQNQFDAQKFEDFNMKKQFNTESINFYHTENHRILVSDGEIIENIPVKVGDPVNLTFFEIMLLSAALSAKDSSAVGNMIDHHCLLDLHSVIFGEGIFNDVTTLAVYQAIFYYDGTFQSGKEFTDLLIILWNLAYGSLISIVIGFVFGFLGSLILKQFRFLQSTPMLELIVLFASGIVSYSLTEAFHLPGTGSLIVTAFMLAHYGWYNLSERSKMSSTITFQFLGQIIMGIMFTAIGFSFFAVMGESYSIALIAYNILFTLVSRIVSISLVTFLHWGLTKFKRPFKFSFRQLSLLYFSGIVRGVLAFALVLSLTPSVTAHYKLLSSTITFIVASTTIIFGSITSLIQHLLLKKEIDKFILTQEEHEKEIIREQRKQLELKKHIAKFQTDSEGEDESGSPQKKKKMSFTSKISSPLKSRNGSISMSEPGEKEVEEKLNFLQKMKNFFKILNYSYIKPMLIYDYYNKMEEYQVEKSLFKEHDGNLIMADKKNKEEMLTRLKSQTITKKEIVLDKNQLEFLYKNFIQNNIDDKGKLKQVQSQITLPSVLANSTIYQNRQHGLTEHSPSPKKQVTFQQNKFVFQDNEGNINTSKDKDDSNSVKSDQHSRKSSVYHVFNSNSYNSNQNNNNQKDFSEQNQEQWNYFFEQVQQVENANYQRNKVDSSSGVDEEQQKNKFTMKKKKIPNITVETDFQLKKNTNVKKQKMEGQNIQNNNEVQQKRKSSLKKHKDHQTNRQTKKSIIELQLITNDSDLNINQNSNQEDSQSSINQNIKQNEQQIKQQNNKK